MLGVFNIDIRTPRPHSCCCVCTLIPCGSEERAQIEAIVTRFGGRYLPHLLLETTHLIALEPAGEKYAYARTWSIPVVHRDWLDARIHSRGACFARSESGSERDCGTAYFVSINSTLSCISCLASVAQL